MFQLRPQRRRVLHAIGLAQAQPAGAGARVDLQHDLGGAGVFLDQLLAVFDRACPQTGRIDAQAHRIGKRRGGPGGRVGV